ncbi:Mitochondrial uncoupling protein 4 [Linum perenne]
MGIKGFLEGGIASIIAGCSTHPLDVIKLRIQLQGKPLLLPSPFTTFVPLSLSIPSPPPSTSLLLLPSRVRSSLNPDSGNLEKGRL